MSGSAEGADAKEGSVSADGAADAPNQSSAMDVVGPCVEVDIAEDGVEGDASAPGPASSAAESDNCAPAQAPSAVESVAPAEPKATDSADEGTDMDASAGLGAGAGEDAGVTDAGVKDANDADAGAGRAAATAAAAATATDNACVIVKSVGFGISTVGSTSSSDHAGAPVFDITKGSGRVKSCNNPDCSAADCQPGACATRGGAPAVRTAPKVDPALQALLAAPLPLPPPSPASVIPAATAGPIGRYIRDHEVDLTLRLMGTVQVTEVSVETMCVINAAIVFFLIAERRGTRPQLMKDVIAAASAVEPSLKPVASFLKLLGFWGEVYHSHSCERRFLEFSSGVPFEHWLSLVEALKSDLKSSIDALPSAAST